MPTHSLPLSHPLYLSLSFSLTLILSPSLIFVRLFRYTYSHLHALAHTLSLYISLSNKPTLSLSLALSPPLSLSLSLSRTNTHTIALSLKFFGALAGPVPFPVCFFVFERTKQKKVSVALQDLLQIATAALTYPRGFPDLRKQQDIDQNTKDQFSLELRIP